MDHEVNSSDIDPEAIIEETNRYNTKIHAPTIAFLLVSFVGGVTSNMLTIYLYSTCLRKLHSSVLILNLAGYDLFSCVVLIPLEVYYVTHSLTYGSETLCQVFRFMVNASSVATCLAIVSIAVDRYIKVCHPLYYVSTTTSKRVCVLILLVSLLSHAPVVPMFGLTCITIHPGADGHRCLIRKGYGKYNVIYAKILGIVFVSTLALNIYCYSMIYCLQHKLSRASVGNRISPVQREQFLAMMKNAKPTIKVQSHTNAEPQENHATPSETSRPSVAASNRDQSLSSKSEEYNRIGSAQKSPGDKQSQSDSLSVNQRQYNQSDSASARKSNDSRSSVRFTSSPTNDQDALKTCESRPSKDEHGEQSSARLAPNAGESRPSKDEHGEQSSARLAPNAGESRPSKDEHGEQSSARLAPNAGETPATASVPSKDEHGEKSSARLTPNAGETPATASVPEKDACGENLIVKTISLCSSKVSDSKTYSMAVPWKRQSTSRGPDSTIQGTQSSSVLLRCMTIPRSRAKSGRRIGGSTLACMGACILFFLGYIFGAIAIQEPKKLKRPCLKATTQFLFRLTYLHVWNPVVYYYCNPQFRAESKYALHKLWAYCKRKVFCSR